MADLPSRWYFPPTVALLHWFAWAILVASLYGVVVTSSSELRDFSFDSWSYWELARSVFSDDFFRINLRRQFQIDTPYSISFPPLWPVMVALAAAATVYEPVVMPILAGFFALATFVVIETAFRWQTGLSGVGLVAGLGMLTFGGYVDEIASGRSIPLALFWLALLCAFSIGRLTRSRAVAMGAAAGLMVMTRFDALPIIAVILLLLAAGVVGHERLSFRDRANLTALFAGGVLLAVSPYILYSLTHFGSPWISDNARVALSAESMFVTEYRTTWPPNAAEAPVQWLQKVLVNAALFSPRIIKNVGGIFAAAAVALWFARRRHNQAPADLPPVRPVIAIAIACTVALSLHFAAGYGGARYQSAAFLTGLVLLAIGLSFGLNGTSAGQRAFAVLVVVAGVVIVAALNRKSSIDPTLLAPRMIAESEIRRDFPPVDSCLGPDRTGSLLILHDNMLAARMGALDARRELLMAPGNLNEMPDDTLRSFVVEYRVGAVLTRATAPEMDAQLLRIRRLMPDLVQCEQLPGLWLKGTDDSGAQ